MKHVHSYLSIFSALALMACTSTPPSGPTQPPNWSQIQPGMSKEQVYAALGQPVYQTQSDAKWKGPELSSGWPRKTYWRELQVAFDENGRVKGTRDYEQEH